MPRASIFPPPGIQRAATPLASSGRWFDQNLMRWRGGTLQPIGGWASLPLATFDSNPRDVLTYHDNSQNRWAIVGTDTALYAYDFGLEVLHVITPTGVGPLEPPGPALGYGTGNYGADAYGTAREPADVGPQDVAVEFGDQWAMDLFGELVMIVPTQDGHLFVWDPTTPDTPAVLVPEAPIQNFGVLVTDERFVVLLGAGGNPRQIAWCDQENFHSWTPTISNQAGTLPVETEGRPLGGIRCPGGNLLFTDNDAHLLHFVGPPYVYGLNKVGANCGLLSRRAYNSAAGLVFWIGKKTFWQYGGAVTPVISEVADWLFSILNLDWAGRLFASSNPAFTEVWWHFPDEGGTECNRYVGMTYGPQSMTWIIGLLDRSAGDIKGAMDRPVLGGNAKLYLHEYGWLDDGASRVGTVYIESADIELAPNGENRFHVTQVMHDYVGDLGAMGFRFFIQEETDGAEWDTGSYPVINGNGLTDVRFSARTMRMRVEGLTDTTFALGRTRLRSRLGGTR
jgi:hypothetical protein